MLMLIKKCLFCQKEFNNLQFPKHFGSRKYCSEDCSAKGFELIQNKYRVRKSLETWKTPHGIKLLEINKVLNGKLIGAKIIAGTYEPDILKDDMEFELEMLYNFKVNKFLKKWDKDRFDFRKPTKRILIISLPEDITGYFDNVYAYQNKDFFNQLKKDFI